MNAKIIIATHKMYDMPQDDIYLPVHVGREGKDALPYQAMHPKQKQLAAILQAL